MRRSIIALAAATAFSGCGGGAVERPEYIAQADAICRDAEKRYPPADDLHDIAGEWRALARSNKGMRETFGRLEHLRRPKEDHSLLETRYFRPYRQALNRLTELERSLRRAVNARDRASAKRLIEESYSVTETPAIAEALQFTESYGFIECAGRSRSDEAAG